MTIDEAINRWEERQEALFVLLPPGDFNMLKLGIEALRRVRAIRADPYLPPYPPLTGETEE